MSRNALLATVVALAGLSSTAGAEEYRGGWAGVGVRLNNSTAHAITLAFRLSPFGYEKLNESLQPGTWENYMFDLYQRTELTEVRAIVTDVETDAVALCPPVVLPAGENLVALRVEATGEGEALECAILQSKFGSTWP